MIQLRGYHWLLGAVIALLLFVGTTIAVLWRAPPPAAVANRGIGGIEIGLGPAGGTAGGPERVEAENEQETSNSEPESEPEPQPEPEPEPEPELEPDPEPEPESEPEPAPKPKPEPKPKPQPKPKPVDHRPAEKPPTPSTANRREPATEKPMAVVAGNEGKSGTTAAADQGSGDNSRGGGQVGQRDAYMAVLQTWLERHREYPRRAQRRRQEGTALLYFVMDRAGKVLRYEIRQSSGHTLLDREVKAMIERAQPLPPMPDWMAQSELELIVPVRFTLR